MKDQQGELRLETTLPQIDKFVVFFSACFLGLRKLSHLAVLNLTHLSPTKIIALEMRRTASYFGYL